jgi:predicted nicotinamide N-methyase
MERIIEVENKRMTIHQDFEYGYAGEIWDAALVFTYFISKEKAQILFPLKSKIILELGAGTGICGLITGLFEPKLIILTDKEENLPLLKKNHQLNKDIMASEVKVLPLDWNNKNHYSQIKENIDYIIASDVIWNFNYFDALLNAFYYFYRDDTIILLSYTYRKPEDAEFFKILKERGWVLEKIPEELYDETYKSHDILLLTMRKLK